MNLNQKILKAINEGLRKSLILDDDILDNEDSPVLKRTSTHIEANSTFELEKEMAQSELNDLAKKFLRKRTHIL